MGVHLLAVLGKNLEDALARGGGELAAGVDAVAETGDVRASDELLDPSVGSDLGDQQSRRVGSDVDDGHAHRGDARGAVLWWALRQWAAAARMGL